MKAMAAPRGSPATKLDTNDDANLVQSMDRLAFSSVPPRSLSRASSHSPSARPIQISTLDRLTINSRSPRSPAFVRSVSNGVGGSPSPAIGTPTLLRKSSTTSLRSTSGITPSRAPSRLGSMSPAPPRSPYLEDVKPPLTAPRVASTYFKSELQQLHGIDTSKPHDTIVILNDACYGHRFSRIKTTKGNLSTIVERPERIQACAVGVALAYVRLGDRHCDGKFPISPQLDPASLPSIPFRIYKTDRRLSLTSPIVVNVHGTKWMDELKMMCEGAEAKLAMGTSELKRPDMDRTESPRPFHEGDLYLCAESMAAFEGALGAICEAVDIVFSASPIKRAFVAVRPPGHHCSASYPQGFCWVNNVHVGIMHGALNHGLTHAAIIDFDLHHGDGSQAIAWDHNQRRVRQNKNAAPWKKTSIGYFSLHDINSYPCENGDIDNIKNASICIDNAHGQSIWNIHLQEWKSEVEFWTLYQSRYSLLIEKARAYLRRESERLRRLGQVPKAAIFLSAGFDASEWEGAGMQRHTVNVPTEFYARLTRDAVKLASEESLAVEGRIISALEGGYSDRALYSGVFSHLSGLAGNQTLPESPNGRHQRLSSVSSISRLSISSEADLRPKVPGFPYDPSWWSGQELDRLETTMVTPIPEPKLPRLPAAPTHYSSPTQASAAKSVNPNKVRRSTSSFFGTNVGTPVISRPPTPPPPDVPWPVAVHQLSKLLIPTDRPTASLTWDDIKADANRAKLQRQSLSSQETMVESCDTTTGVRKSLRERKPTKPTSPTEVEDPNKGRRRTVAGAAVLASEKAQARGIPAQSTKHARQQSRRLSMASTMTTATAMTTLDNGDTYEPSPPREAFTRPTTSQSIRPESSMSVRTNVTTGLNVRKTRPTAPAKKESAKAAPKPRRAAAKTTTAKDGPPKTTPVVQTPAPVSAPVSASAAAQNRKQNAASDVALSSTAPSTAPSTTNSEPESDVSKVANGVKKIKINVVTKEMKEARQRAEAERPSASSNIEPKQPLPLNGTTKDGAHTPTAPVNTPQKTQTGEPIVDSPMPGSSASVPRNMNSTPATPATQKTKSQVEALTSGFEKLGLVSSPPGNQQRGQQQANTADTFVPYQPEGTTPEAVETTGPIQWLPPNTIDTPKAVKKGHQFTSTSTIPFATSQSAQETRAMNKEKAIGQGQPARVKMEAKNDSVWEIPETPVRHR